MRVLSFQNKQRVPFPPARRSETAFKQEAWTQGWMKSYI